MSGGTLRIRLVGELSLWVDGAPRAGPRGRGPRALLAWLALHPGLNHRTAVAAALWPGYADGSARNSLRTALSALRAELGGDWVVIERDRIGLVEDGRVAIDPIEDGEDELLPEFDDGWTLDARDRRLELRGVDARQRAGGDHAHARRWEPGLPSRLHVLTRDEFAARHASLARLRDSWRRALDGRRRMALVVGEAGSGKSRLCAQLAAPLDDAIVLYGACPQDPADPAHAFAQALGPLDRAAPGAVCDLLASACETRPVLLVVEDLQWADAATLLVLEQIVRTLVDARLLIVATYRDEALDRAPRLVAALAELRREEPYELLTLEDLEEDEVRSLMAARLGVVPAPALVAAMLRRSGGNPLYVDELVRYMVTTSICERTRVPERVQLSIAERVDRLSGPARRALDTAAGLGREFDYVLLSSACPLDDDTLEAALDEALAARLLLERGPAYAFRHSLVRDALSPSPA